MQVDEGKVKRSRKVSEHSSKFAVAEPSKKKLKSRWQTPYMTYKVIMYIIFHKVITRDARCRIDWFIYVVFVQF
jgi:hypothetical protein